MALRVIRLINPQANPRAPRVHFARPGSVTRCSGPVDGTDGTDEHICPGEQEHFTASTACRGEHLYILPNMPQATPSFFPNMGTEDPSEVTCGSCRRTVIYKKAVGAVDEVVHLALENDCAACSRASDGYTGTDDPSLVTCKACLKTKAWKDRVEWVPLPDESLQLRSLSFSVSRVSAKTGMLTIELGPMEAEEMEVAADLVLERLQPWMKPGFDAHGGLYKPGEPVDN